MLVRLLVKMLCILVLCPALLVAVQTLTIDSQLGTSIEGKKYQYISKNSKDQVRFNLIMPTPLNCNFCIVRHELQFDGKLYQSG